MKEGFAQDLTATDFHSLLTTMKSGTHRVFNINGHRVYVNFSLYGERYLLIDGKDRYSFGSTTFIQDVNSKLMEKK